MTDKELLEQWLQQLGEDTWDHALYKASKVVSCSKEETTFALTVGPALCNALGTMHGGINIAV